MYILISRLSFIIRFYVCYITIEQYPIFQDPSINWIVWQIVSIYTILWIITYTIVWNISARTRVSWTEKSIVYFFIYLGFVVIVYVILFLLTALKILPIL